MWYKNIAGRFFGLVTKHACMRQTDGRTELGNDSQDCAIAQLRRAVNRGHGSQIWGQVYPPYIGLVIQRMHSGCKRIIWEVSQHITQERIGVRFSKLVGGLTMRPAMYDH